MTVYRYRKTAYDRWRTTVDRREAISAATRGDHVEKSLHADIGPWRRAFDSFRTKEESPKWHRCEDEGK